ncbi:MAG TPA: hypothetical protein DER23_02945 [Clostridiales bacterium]|jgi:hypothetical protein|nr:hypothetical protein [Clostridiales bacterium]HCG35280.1 hypothetical protein [Clostridiales bacterium]
MYRNHLKLLFLHLIILGLLLLAGFYVGCLFLYLFEIPCPCCGITRAWLFAFCGELKTAVRYHPLFFLIPVAVWLGLHQKLFPVKYAKGIQGLILIIATMTFFLYLYRAFYIRDSILWISP